MPQATRLLSSGHPETGMQAPHLTSPESFTADDHVELIHTFFTTENGSTLSGVWECAPCREEFDSYPVHETMTVISGSVIITNDGGAP